ncbi:MAG: SlyX family protein [Pseudomonadales bacterium]|nr:SlyX family protein [Pseudomonadales bacterium]
MSEERLVELEIRTTYQEDTLAALSDVVAQQQRLIDQLQRELKDIRDLLLEGPGDKQAGSGIELPPHY